MLADGEQAGALFGSGSLLDDLVRYVRSGRECRLVLVGDSAQLPPVGSDRSPALDVGTMGRYGDVVGATMDEVVRQQAESGILFNATLVRCMLENGICEVPRFVTGFPDFEAIEGGEFSEKLQECYDRYGRDETIVITRSNKRANRYNEGIRRNVLGAEEEIESGDMLMVVKNNYHFTEREKDCPMGFVANGDIARLKRLRRFEEFYGFRFAEAVLSFGDYVQNSARHARLGIAVAFARTEHAAVLRGGERLPGDQEQAQTLSRNPGKSALQRLAGQVRLCRNLP